MLIHKEPLSGTTSSGALSVSTSNFRGVECHMIYVAPATASTIYNISITDEDNLIVFEELDVEGSLKRSVEIPMRGAYTVAIAVSSVDELFTMALGIVESY